MKKTRIFGVLLGVLAGLGFAALAQAANPILYLQAAKTTLSTSEQITVNVVLDTKDQTVSAADLHLSFPSNLLQAQSITAGTLLPTVLAAGATTSSTATIILGCDPTAPFKGVGTIATIVFNASSLSGNAVVTFDSTTQVAAVGLNTNALDSTTSMTFTISAPADTTHPTVSITAPTNNATVSGTTSVTATASDNVGVSGVQFKLDGANLGTEDTTSPYSYSWNTTGVSSGAHSLTATARDAAGNTTTSSTINVTVNNSDTSAPTTPLGLSATAVSASAINLSWTASTDNVGVTGYQIYRCAGTNCTPSATSIASPTTNSYSDTGLTASTSYRYRVKAVDAAGNASGYSSPLVLATTQSNVDTTHPTVSITAPTSGATVSGTTSVTATASDNVGVAGVQFKLDGVNLGTEDTTSPYSSSWDTTTATNGSHTLTAVARDAAGNTTTSNSVSVTVNNDKTAPVISNIVLSGISSTGATIAWSTNEASDSQVEFGITTSYGQTTNPNLSLVTSHTVALTSLSANTFYYFRVKSKDAAGNLTTSAGQTFATTNAPDITAPIVSITAPTSGATVSGTITLSATASDPVVSDQVTSGLSNVVFKIDGTTIGTDTAAPYTYALDTTALSNGTHTLTARATDGANNLSTIFSINVNVSNSVPSPAPVTPTLSVALSATPDSGAASLSGVALSATLSGTATGTSNFYFYCDRNDTTTSLAINPDQQYLNDSSTVKSTSGICLYATAGTYTAKVIVERNNLISESRANVIVSAPLPVSTPPGGGGGGGGGGGSGGSSTTIDRKSVV